MKHNTSDIYTDNNNKNNDDKNDNNIHRCFDKWEIKF